MTGVFYTSSNCGGFDVSREFPIPSSCTNGTLLVCEEKPTAIAEKWPAVGIYLEDSTCSSPIVVGATKPDVCVSNSNMEDFSFESSCTEDFTMNTYNDSSTCDTEPMDTTVVDIGTCDEIGEFPLPSPTTPYSFDRHAGVKSNVMSTYSSILSRVTSMSHLKEKDTAATRYLQQATVTAYSYASCEGVGHIQGVTIADDDADDADDAQENSSGSASSKNGLGAVGISLVTIFVLLSAAGLVAGYVFVVKPKLAAKAKGPLDATPLNTSLMSDNRVSNKL